MLSLPNMQKVASYNESQTILLSSNRPAIRLQANPDKGRTMAYEQYQNMWTNINFLKEMAELNPHVQFLWVSGETLSYWTFYIGGASVHINAYLGNSTIGFPRDQLVVEANKVGVDI